MPGSHAAAFLQNVRTDAVREGGYVSGKSLTACSASRGDACGTWPMTDDVDIVAMARLKTGDDHALGEIMERWQVRVTGFLLRMVSDQTVAVDLAQETFVRVYQSNQRYRPTGIFPTWLFSIAANLARQHLRWQRRHPTVSMDAEPQDAV